MLPKSIGNKPLGVRIGVWPLSLDEYRSDTEPLSTAGPLRFVQWHRVTRTDTPPGWWKLPGETSQLCIGIHNNLNSNYTAQWKKNAAYYSRHFKQTLRGSIYEIQKINFTEFASAFAYSTVAKDIPTLEIQKLKKRLELFPEKVSLVGVLRKSDNKLVAGINTFDSPQNKASHYGCGFYLPEVAKDHLMVSLMDEWFNLSVQKKLRVLHFGLFTPPGTGTGRSKTISDFKAQFVTHYIEYQPPLWQLTRGKIF